MWDHLHLLSSKYPVEGNKDGTYLTFFSIGGFIFGIINIIGNFGTVFNDQARPHTLLLRLLLHTLLFGGHALCTLTDPACCAPCV